MTSSSLHKNQLVDKKPPFVVHENACIQPGPEVQLEGHFLEVSQLAGASWELGPRDDWVDTCQRRAQAAATVA